MKRLIVLLAALLVACSLAVAARADGGFVGHWGNDIEHGSYLEVHEAFFTDYLRLTGKYDTSPPYYCDDVNPPATCFDDPTVELHVFFHGRQVYSTELLAYDGKFSERIYWYQLGGFGCNRAKTGLYTWRITMNDPFGRAGHQTNVRHVNGIRIFCR